MQRYNQSISLVTCIYMSGILTNNALGVLLLRTYLVNIYLGIYGSAIVHIIFMHLFLFMFIQSFGDSLRRIPTSAPANANRMRATPPCVPATWLSFYCYMRGLMAARAELLSFAACGGANSLLFCYAAALLEPILPSRISRPLPSPSIILR